MKGTNVFAMIGKSLFESQAGRIRWTSNMWAIVGGQWDKRRVTNCLGDIVCGDHVLVRKPMTHCPHPPADGFYFDGKWWSVPAVVCRKCEFHRVSNRSFRFPRCTWKKPTDKATVATNTFVQLNEMLDKAVGEAAKIVRGESV